MTTTPPPSEPPPAVPPPPPAAPPVSPEERVRRAYVDRPNVDYVFTNLGMVIFLTIITCGIFGFYVFYQLMRRMRDHNRRRLEMLQGATDLAWQRASAQGLADELRPNFERIAGNLEVLRAQTREFRDPGAWLGILIGATVLSGLGFVVWMVGFVLLDGDLIKHDRNEGAVEAELAFVYGRLGHAVPAPDPNRVKGQQNYAGRIVATIFTCGIYGLWWMHNQMTEGNRHFEHNWPWEDGLAGAVQQMTGAQA